MEFQFTIFIFSKNYALNDLNLIYFSLLHLAVLNKKKLIKKFYLYLKKYTFLFKSLYVYIKS